MIANANVSKSNFYFRMFLSFLLLSLNVFVRLEVRAKFEHEIFK